MPDNHEESVLLVTDRIDESEREYREKTLPHEETQIEYETADLTQHVQFGDVETKPVVRVNSPLPRPRPAVSVRSPRPNPFTLPVVLVTDAKIDVSDSATSETRWQGPLRGMPSWLTSLVVHLSVIMVMTFVSISDGGRSVIEMLASAEDVENVEPYASIDFDLDPVDLEPLTEEIVLPDSQLMQPSGPCLILESALLDASLAKESGNGLYESLATEGLLESDRLQNESGNNASFFGVGNSGMDFVFIVDCSGSMADYGRWQRAVRELKQSVSKLKKDQRFLILLYNDGFIAMNDDATLVKSDSRSQKKAFKWLANNRPDSMTFCAEALGKALSLKPDAVFLLSDGEFNDLQDVFLVLDTMNSPKRLARYNQQQIPVHTIALGSHFGKETMERIANENSGEFKLVE